MLNDLSSTEYEDWLWFASHEPIGYQRSDYQVGQLSCLLANQYRDTKKNKPLTIADFMPFDKPDKQETDHKALSANIMSNFKQYTGGG